MVLRLRGGVDGGADRDRVGDRLGMDGRGSLGLFGAGQEILGGLAGTVAWWKTRGGRRMGDSSE